MESFDREKARQVWERVNGSCDRGPDLDALTALLCQELTDAAVLLRLSKRIGGRGGELLGLAHQCRQHAGYLRGICTIVGQGRPRVAVPLPADTTASAALRKCYVNSINRLRHYEQFSSDPDYGPVFHAMTHTAKKQCATLLDLIGKVET